MWQWLIFTWWIVETIAGVDVDPGGYKIGHVWLKFVSSSKRNKKQTRKLELGKFSSGSNSERRNASGESANRDESFYHFPFDPICIGHCWGSSSSSFTCDLYFLCWYTRQTNLSSYVPRLQSTKVQIWISLSLELWQQSSVRRGDILKGHNVEWMWHTIWKVMLIRNCNIV